MSSVVNIQIKNDYFAYITCKDAKLFSLLEKSFTRQIRKYNNYWKLYENKSVKHYTLVDYGRVLKVKAGLIDFLIESFKQKDINYTLTDERNPVKIKTKIVKQLNSEITLRDYQEETVKAVFNNGGFCSIQLPTSSGKTECSASIIRTYLNNYFNRAVLYIVPTVKLQQEAEERFIEYGIKCNTKLPFISGGVNIFTYMALVRSKIDIIERDKIGAILNDEAHHLKGSKFSKIVHNYRKLNMCVGISATVTPDIQYKKQLKQLNDNDFNILGSTGKPVYWKTTKKQQKEKFITPIDVTVVENKEKIILSDEEQGDWHSVKRNVLMSAGRANLTADFTKYICEQNNFYTLMLLIPEVEWSKQFMLAVAQYGNKDYRYILMFGQNKFCEIINGKLVTLKKKEEKEEAYDAIKNPNIKTIFSATSFAYEGLDIPNLQALLNIYGGRSEVRIKQQIGRLTRLFKGKDIGHVFEIYDKNPVCESQLKKRLSIYLKEYNAKIIKSDYDEN